MLQEVELQGYLSIFIPLVLIDGRLNQTASEADNRPRTSIQRASLVRTGGHEPVLLSISDLPSVEVFRIEIMEDFVNTASRATNDRLVCPIDIWKAS